MFTINDDLSIYVTRGDRLFFAVTAQDEGKPYKFQPGDVVRIKVFGKKDAENVVLQKDFPVMSVTENVEIYLTEQDTKIGGVISKPTDYWYEVELNPYDDPQTIIGYDEDGAKVFRLLPEGRDLTENEPDIKPEDIPVMDKVLDMTSLRPVQNQAIARAVARLDAAVKNNNSANSNLAEQVAASNASIEQEVVVERARIDNLLSGSAADDAEVVDIRVGEDGETYGSAGTAVRKQFSRKIDKLGFRQVGGHNLAFAETGTNILPPLAVDVSETGMQLNADTGKVYEAASCSVTGYIPIEPNTTYYFYSVSVYGYALVAFNRAVLYDKNHAYIQSVTDGENHEFTTPENAAFLRFSEGNGTGVTLHNKYLGKVNHAPYLPSSQWFRLPEKREITTESINLFAADRLLQDSRIKITAEHGMSYTSAEMVNPTTGYYRTDFIELDTTKTTLFCGVKVFEGVRYTDGDQKDLAFFDDQYRYIGAVIHLADGNAIPETARYVLHHTGYLDTIISYEKQEVFCKQDPEHFIGNKEIAVVDKENTWNGRVWAAYGDSIAAISNGNALNVGWAAYVNKAHKFSGFYGRSIGGQRYSWGNAGGAVAFINADGTFNSRNDSYNLDNYTGDIPDGCTAVRGAFCSWSRITAMFPESMKESVDMVFIMGGTNDELNDTPVQFIKGAQTDHEWAASEQYAVYGGDYNINTLRGGMASTVMKFHAWMPNAVIVVGTNLSGKGAAGEVGTDLDMSEYSKSLIEKEMASRMSCPCIDVYSTCGINPWNSREYISDGVHPYMESGEMMLGRTIVGGLNSITPKLAIIEK